MLIHCLVLALCFAGCVSSGHRVVSGAPVSLTLTDVSRQRPVTILMYGQTARGRPKPLAIISHGYGGHDTDYSFIAHDLVARGYVVASIDHSSWAGSHRW